MLVDLELAWLLGAPGLLFGAWAGRRMGRAGATAGRVAATAAIGGLVCGAAFVPIMVHEVLGSTSSTAAIGLIVLPVPLLANQIAALTTSLLVWACAGGLRAASER